MYLLFFFFFLADHLCILQITDETMDTADPYLDVRVFGKPQDLKMVKDLGDIVRIDRYELCMCMDGHHHQIVSMSCDSYHMM